MQIRPISSLVKVFPDETGDLPIFAGDTAARNEIYSFQVALRAENEVERDGRIRVAVSGGLNVEIRQVESVPSLHPVGNTDGDYLRTAPGLYPDLLADLEAHDRFNVLEGQWRVLWCTVRVGGAAPGKYPITLDFLQMADWDKNRDGLRGSACFTLEVLDFELPPQELLRLEWFHSDCLVAYYGVPAWSEKHWQITHEFLRNAFAHGVNVLYTPLWTPPLDTEVGLERPTCQLLDVEKLADGSWKFDFTRLGQWIDLAREIGFRHFAMSHLFTQWGAEFTPKIVGRDGNFADRRFFGWTVRADDPAYKGFLEALLPRLLPFLRSKGLDPEHCFFSVSDEPQLKQLDSYRAAVQLVKPLLEDYRTLEALSNFDFYQLGLVDIAIPANNHIEPFAGKMKHPWSYYCCSQQIDVPNRFFALPSRRNRVMGILAYVYELEGFLQWGFNFYYSQFSRRLINPFLTTDAGGRFPSGDCFMVYPGRDGEPIDSIRHEVFHAGLQDLRALKLLESRAGREKVLALLHEGLEKPLKMDDYPRTDAWLLGVRSRVNAALAK